MPGDWESLALDALHPVLLCDRQTHESVVLQVHVLHWHNRHLLSVGQRLLHWYVVLGGPEVCQILGYFAINGDVFCSHPRLIYILGMFGLGR